MADLEAEQAGYELFREHVSTWAKRLGLSPERIRVYLGTTSPTNTDSVIYAHTDWCPGELRDTQIVLDGFAAWALHDNQLEHIALLALANYLLAPIDEVGGSSSEDCEPGLAKDRLLTRLDEFRRRLIAA